MKTKNNLKKVLSAVLILMMVVSTMVIMPLATSAAAVQPAGEGTAESPYILSTADHCQWIREHVAEVNATAGATIYMEMANHIDVSGYSGFKFDTQSWSKNTWFFNGNGYTLSGLTVMPFFSAASASVFENLTIADSHIKYPSDGGYSFGGLVGYGSPTIQNCVMAADVTVEATNAKARPGAFTGYGGKFYNCINYATVIGGTDSSQGSGAGFSGTFYSGTTIIENCVNYGTISGYYAGGFCGNVTGGTLNMTNCVNAGAVNATYYGSAFIGGPTVTANLTNCYNTGKISNGTYDSMPLYNSAPTLIDNNDPNLDADELCEQIVASLNNSYKKGTAPEAVNAWDGTFVKPNLLDETAANSATNPYLVTNAKEFAYFSGANAEAPTQYYVQLTDNINLGGAFWGGLKNAASNEIVIDGNGYAIYNMTTDLANAYTAGLFMSVNGNAIITVQNLHFGACRIQAYGTAVAVLFGSVTGGTGSLVAKNISIAGDCIVYGNRSNGAHVGAIMGSSYESYKGSLVIENVISEAYMNQTCGTADLKIGGFVGQMPSNTTGSLTITNSVAAGLITASSNSVRGKLFGLTSNLCTVTLNNAMVKSDAGLVSTYNANSVQMKNCYSSATVGLEIHEAALATINDAAYGALNIAEGKGNLSTRLQLQGGYGFLLLGKLPAKVAEVATEVGFVVNGEKVVGEIVDGKVVVEITDAKVATLDTDYSVTLYAVINGVESASAIRENVLNPYDLMNELLADGDEDGVADGKYQGVVVVTEAKELAVYAEMVTYYNNLKAWLEQQ